MSNPKVVEMPRRVSLLRMAWYGVVIVTVVSVLEYFADLSDGALAAVGAVVGLITAVMFTMTNRPPPPGPEQTVRLTKSLIRHFTEAMAGGTVPDLRHNNAAQAEAMPKPIMVFTNVLELILTASLVVLPVVVVDALGVEVPGALYGAATGLVTAYGTVSQRLLEPEPDPLPDEEFELPVSTVQQWLHNIVHRRS